MPELPVTVSQLFDASNLVVLPFWTLMILLPKWSVTRRLMSSYIPFVGLALLYIYLLVGTITPESAEALANPNVTTIAEFFADERAAATGWVHFVVMDLFVGRWVYLEGQRTGLFTSHSVALCLFAGPIGLLTHILTQWSWGAWKQWRGDDPSADDSAASETADA